MQLLRLQGIQKGGSRPGYGVCSVPRFAAYIRREQLESRRRHQDRSRKPGTSHSIFYAGCLRPCDSGYAPCQCGSYGPVYSKHYKRIKGQIKGQIHPDIAKALENTTFSRAKTGADGGTRTRTPNRAPAPQAGQSTYSSTSAYLFSLIIISSFLNLSTAKFSKKHNRVGFSVAKRLGVW